MNYRKENAHHGSIALITGASSGIGKELAYCFATNGFKLILVARTVSALEDISVEIQGKFGVDVVVIPQDLAQVGAAEELFSKINELQLPVEVLVNNAGFGFGGRFDKVALHTHRDLIQVNITALTELSRLFIPHMYQRGSGRILNVASTAAFQPGPFLASYYASKAYVLSLSEAMAEESRGTGVTVTALCPGPTHTKFSENARLNRSRLFNSPFTMKASEVAEFGYRAAINGKRVAIPGVINKMIAFGNRLIPRWVATRIARSLQEG